MGKLFYRRNLGKVLDELNEDAYWTKAGRSSCTVVWNDEVNPQTLKKLDDLLDDIKEFKRKWNIQ